MQKAKLYTRLTKHSIRSRAQKVLCSEWTALKDRNNPYNFKQPGAEAIDAKVKDMGLLLDTYVEQVTIMSYGFEGSNEEMYAVAIIQQQDGFLATTAVENLKVIDNAEV